jgi:predicted transcriptional regulator
MGIECDNVGGNDAVLVWLAIGGGALGFLLATWRTWAFPLLIPLYTRLERADVATHPTRAAALDAMRAQPGISTAALAGTLATNEGTLLYHLRQLERSELAKSVVIGRDRRWFPAGAPRDALPPAALQERSRRHIVDALRLAPGISQADLARELGLSRPAVHHHLSALREAGLVEVRREGLRTRCFAM